MTGATPAEPDIDAMLLALPVRPENASKVVAVRRAVEALIKDRDSWKREFEMYAHAWLRSLGNRLFAKRHRIDALVLTTEHTYRWYRYGVACCGFSDRHGNNPPEPPRDMVIGDLYAAAAHQFPEPGYWVVDECRICRQVHGSLLQDEFCPGPQRWRAAA